MYSDKVRFKYCVNFRYLIFLPEHFHSNLAISVAIFNFTLFVLFLFHFCNYAFFNFLVHCRFDKRITEFAEQKFERDGIDVKLGSMVVKVSEKEISAKERGTGQVVSIPHGMVIWSTGIGPRPEIVEFMKQLGQVCLYALLSIQGQVSKSVTISVKIFLLGIFCVTD